ncbi:hypothetical protein pb186bvf_004976 [Paramecium bursaria]
MPSLDLTESTKSFSLAIQSQMYSNCNSKTCYSQTYDLYFFSITVFQVRQSYLKLQVHKKIYFQFKQNNKSIFFLYNQTYFEQTIINTEFFKIYLAFIQQKQ